MPGPHKTARELEEEGKGPLEGESEYARQKRLLAEQMRRQGLVYDPGRDQWVNPAVMPPLDDGSTSINNACKPGRRI